jgi:hypothetical protein
MLETKKSTGEGEVRFKRVFNPKTQFNPKKSSLHFCCDRESALRAAT